MKKILVIFLAIIIGIVLLFTIGKNLILKAAIEGGVKAATGVHLTMDKLNIDFIDTMVEIKGLKLYNPKGFPERIMCEIPEIYLDLDLPALFKGKIHIEEMTLNLKELVVIKNAEGETNINSLKPVKKSKEEAEEKPAEKKEEKAKGEAPKLQIDVLNLKVGQVIYKDYSQGGEPAIKEYNVNLDDKYENITDPGALVSLILVKSLMKTQIAKLTNLDMTDLKSMVKGQLPKTEAFQTTAEEMAKDVAEKFKSLF